MSPYRIKNKRISSPLSGFPFLRTRNKLPEKPRTPRQAVSELGTRMRVSSRYAQTRMQNILLTHGWRFFIFSLLMRLPASMVMLAVMMMLAYQNNEATLGGYAAGTVGISAAFMIPVYRRLSDRWGQHKIFFAVTVLNILALVWLLLESLSFAEGTSGSITRFLLAAALTGITTVPLGTVMRTYWSAEYLKTKDRRKLNVSISLETMLDVIALPAGAVIAGLSTLVFNAQATLFSVLIIDVLGLLMILWRPGSLPIERRDMVEGKPKPLRGGNRSLLWLPQTGMICLGTVLGSTQAAIVAFALSTDQISVTGFLIALLGLFAVASALFIIFERLPAFTWVAWLLSGLGLTAATLLLSLPSSLEWLVLALVLVGLSYGICLVVVDSALTSLAARSNLDLALSTMQACSLGGIAVGFVWAADLSESYNHQVALLVPLIAAVFFFILGHLYGFLWRSMYEERLAPLPQD